MKILEQKKRLKDKASKEAMAKEKLNLEVNKIIEEAKKIDADSS